MKIAMVINSSSGLYNFRKDLINYLNKIGHKVIALTPLDKRVDQLKELGIILFSTKIYRRSINPIKDLNLLKTYYEIIKKEKPDLVITYTIKPNIYAGIICSLLGITYAANITGLGTAFERKGILNYIVTVLNRCALKKAKCVFFENSYNLDLYLSKRIIQKNQAVLLNGAGVNLEYFYYSPILNDHDNIRFLFVGRIMKEKGVDELFEAMRRLHNKGINCVLDVLGNFEERYEEKIRIGEEEGWLKYHGYQKDVRPYIINCDCFVLPSYHEGMANTNLECASMGRPVITSNIPGCKEAVINNTTGFLCNPKDSEDLYSKMEEYINTSHEKKSEMGYLGRKHMERNFDKRIIIEKTISALF